VAYALAPLTELPFRIAYYIWFAVNLLLLTGLLLALRSQLGGLPAKERRAWIALAAVSMPVVALLCQGQLDLLVLTSMLGCMTLLARDQPTLAGLVLSLAVVKPHFAAAAVLLLLVQGEFKTLAVFAVAGAVLLSVPLLTGSPQAFAEQADLVWSYPSSADANSVNAKKMVNLRGTVASVWDSAGVAVWGPPLVLAAAGAVFVAIKRWRSTAIPDAQAWALALTLPVIYSPHVHFHSLVLMLGALGLFARAAIAAGEPPPIARVAMFHVVVLILWFLSSATIGLLSIVVIGAFAVMAWRWPRAESAQSASVITR
jgi:hypothetical protein